MAYSAQFYARLAAKLSAYIDTASAGVLARMGTQPPFVERKTPAERYDEYMAAAALRGHLEEMLAAAPDGGDGMRADIRKLYQRYAGSDDA